MEDAALPENIGPQKPFQTQNSIRKTLFLNLPKMIGITLVIFSIAVGFTVYSKYKNAKQELNEYKEDPHVLAFKEKYDLISRIEKHVYIGTNETPTIATVTNSQSLKELLFFSQAENGDKVLVYPATKRAILYRPSTDKIIEATSIDINSLENTVNNAEGIFSSSSAPRKTEEPEIPQQVLGASDKEEEKEVEKASVKEFKLTILNGTNYEVEGLASKASDNLQKDSGDFSFDILSLGNAQESYDKSVLVNLSGENNSSALSFLSQKFNADVVSALPEKEEVNTEANILLIVGRDFSEQ